MDLTNLHEVSSRAAKLASLAGGNADMAIRQIIHELLPDDAKAIFIELAAAGSDLPFPELIAKVANAAKAPGWTTSKRKYTLAAIEAYTKILLAKPIAARK